MSENATLEAIKRRTSDRNFDNDVVNILNNMRRYKMVNDPIAIGSSTYDGAILEFMLATIDELHGLVEKLDSITAKIKEIEEHKCSCVDLGEENINTVVEVQEELSGSTQLDIDGGETPVEALPEPKPQAKKTATKSPSEKKK